VSPFEAETARLAERVAGLSLPAQVGLFAAAAEALKPRYLNWVSESKGVATDQRDLLSRAVDEAFKFAEGDAASTSIGLLSELEEAAPGEPLDVLWATTAQDCWVCASTAVRSSLETFAAQDATWFLLESMFQATSQRLFGFTDVGSDREDELEGQALHDPALQAAVSALDSACAALGAATVDRAYLERLVANLAPIRP
jgi:hypothetical protein